jgi:xanthine dehydrogenase accessory factor
VERTYRSDSHPYSELLRLARAGRRAVLATVVKTDGSSPQVAGASALFTTDGLACGTVGGGFVESEIVQAARTALRGRGSRLIRFDLSDESFEDADGVCGGGMTVLLDAAPDRNVRALGLLAAAGGKRRAGVLATFVERGRGDRIAGIVRRWVLSSGRAPAPSAAGFPGFAAAIATVWTENRPQWLEEGRRCLYLEPHAPRPRLVIAGAGHVGRAVARLGTFLGFEVAVVDDRAEFASQGRFPEAEQVVVADPATYLGALRLSATDHVVIVTRGHRGDENALRACIRRRPAYLGMIGSRRKIELMRERFLRSGEATERQWARVHAPIGLPIGSRTVEEIAVSIAAELVRERRRAE